MYTMAISTQLSIINLVVSRLNGLIKWHRVAELDTKIKSLYAAYKRLTSDLKTHTYIENERKNKGILCTKSKESWGSMTSIMQNWTKHSTRDIRALCMIKGSTQGEYGLFLYGHCKLIALFTQCISTYLHK